MYDSIGDSFVMPFILGLLMGLLYVFAYFIYSDHKGDKHDKR